MSIQNEFATVDLVANAGVATSGIDAFALSIIKAERQIRRLFTHIVFQCPAFTRADIPALRTALWDHKRCYFEGFERGINGLLPMTLDQLLGAQYQPLRVGIESAIEVRNKVFHGQLTDQSLSQPDLIAHVGNVRVWCQAVADAGAEAVGYDGFQRNSFRKGRADVALNFKRTLPSVAEYRRFLRDWVERRRGWQPPQGW